MSEADDRPRITGPTWNKQWQLENDGREKFVSIHRKMHFGYLLARATRSLLLRIKNVNPATFSSTLKIKQSIHQDD